MVSVTQTQVRCATCNRRLADVVNEVQAGLVIFELICPRCGQPHLEFIRPSAPPKDESPPKRSPEVSKSRQDPRRADPEP
jgi:phage FluMu protein Com